MMFEPLTIADRIALINHEALMDAIDKALQSTVLDTGEQQCYIQ
jgi:hypothetical protein